MTHPTHYGSPNRLMQILLPSALKKGESSFKCTILQAATLILSYLYDGNAILDSNGEIDVQNLGMVVKRNHELCSFPRFPTFVCIFLKLVL